MTTFDVSVSESATAGDSSDAVVSSTFALVGGRYGLTANASLWPAGNVKLLRLAGDQSTFVDIATFTAPGVQSVVVPAGTYKVTTTVGASTPTLDIVKQPAS